MKTLKQIMLGTTASVGLVLGAAVSTTAVLAPVASAQSYTTGAIGGTVRDQAGNPIGGATVTIVSSARGTVRSVSSGADGAFFIGRLPIGEHTITVESDGYQSQSDDSISVAVGTRQDLTFTLAAGSVADIITVTGSAVQANTFSVAETGLNIDVDEVFEQIPVGRDITSLTLLAPGTTRADSAFGGASIAGSSAGENVFYINGLNVTNFRNFVGASTIPFEFYEQVEVKTGGYQAEFGRSTGGVVNAVTRSGTNEFHWGFNAFYQPDELTEDRPNTTTARNDLDQFTETNMDFYVSGPIVNDRVFFYGLYSPRYSQDIDYTTSGQRFETRDDDPFWGVQVDANLFEGHTLAFTAFSDRRTEVTTTMDVTYDANGDVMMETNPREGYAFRGGDIYILNYTGELTDWLTMSVTAGTQGFDQTVQSSADQYPAVYERSDSGVFSPLGNAANFTIEEGSDQRELFRVDFDAQASFFGEHSFRFGMDREDLTADASVINSGGVYYLYATPSYCENFGGPAGESCVRVRDYSVGGMFNTIQTAFYIQDSWEVNDQLTLNLGLRRETFDNRNADGETFVEIADQLAPRIAAAYDLFGDGEIELYGSWGRYHLPVATNTNIRMAGAETYIHSYYEYDGRDANYVPNLVGDPFRTTVTGDGTVPDTRSLIATDLDPMFSDELILGARFNKWENWDLNLTFTHRELASTLEDVAIDAAVIAYCNANGIVTNVSDGAGGFEPCEEVWDGFHQYVLTNPGQDMTTFLPELGVDGEYVTLTADQLNYPEVERTYTALDINVAHWGDNYQLNASWTISESSGNYEGSVKSDNGQDDAGITQDFDQPGLVDGSDGLLPNHRAHRIKLWGSYNVTEDFTVGANMQITSPRHFGCIGYHPTDEFAYVYGASSWYCGGQLTPRGESMESDWITEVDMSFVYSPTDLPYPGQPTFRMDVFNIFNSDSVNDLYETGDSSAPEPGPLYDASAVVANPRYGEAIGFQSPRSVRFGISWDF